jgi:hypothetical protein
MSDVRPGSEISPASVFLALLHAFVFGLPSFQQREAERGHSYLQHGIGAERPFRDDTWRYSLCGFNLEPLEHMRVDLNRRRKRRKAFEAGGVQGPWVAALDCIEVLSSFSRRPGQTVSGHRVAPARRRRRDGGAAPAVAAAPPLGQWLL